MDMTLLYSIVHVAIFYGEYQIHDQDQVGIFILACTASHIQHIVLVIPQVDSFGPVTAMNAECIWNCITSNENVLYIIPPPSPGHNGRHFEWKISNFDVTEVCS